VGVLQGVPDMFWSPPTAAEIKKLTEEIKKRPDLYYYRSRGEVVARLAGPRPYSCQPQIDTLPLRSRRDSLLD
jgi:hypothetical protein